MPSAATLPPTAAAPAAAPTPVPSTPVPLAAPTPGSAPAAGGSSPAPRERQTATIRYVDRPDVGETFADSITGLVFDGQTLRIEDDDERHAAYRGFVADLKAAAAAGHARAGGKP